MLLERIAKGSSDVGTSKQNEYPIFNLFFPIKFNCCTSLGITVKQKEWVGHSCGMNVQTVNDYILYIHAQPPPMKRMIRNPCGGHSERCKGKNLTIKAPQSICLIGVGHCSPYVMICSFLTPSEHITRVNLPALRGICIRKWQCPALQSVSIKAGTAVSWLADWV